MYLALSKQAYTSSSACEETNIARFRVIDDLTGKDGGKNVWIGQRKRHGSRYNISDRTCVAMHAMYDME